MLAWIFQQLAEAPSMNEAPVSLLIGEGPLAARCGDALLRAGHKVALVHSPERTLTDWAAARDIRYTSDLNIFVTESQNLNHDYLFSIVNFSVLPGDVVVSPRRFAINYHNSILPQYGGLNAPAWAILNGESHHGVTWHVMAERVDQGDILKQTTFPIAPEDTTGTLIMKCFMAATRSFPQLLKELELGTFTRTPQDLTQRSFFAKSKLPAPSLIIPFEWPAERICAYVRALDYGAEPGPWGRPRIQIDGTIYTVGSVRTCAEKTENTAGIVLARALDWTRISTGTRDVEFLGLSS